MSDETELDLAKVRITLADYEKECGKGEGIEE